MILPPEMIPGVLAPLSIPSPPQGVWYVPLPFGDLTIPIRAYALCILVGIGVAWVVGSRRWRARGGTQDTLETALLVAIPLGIIGARLYHVITDHQLYFGPGKHPVEALYIWNGGLGIWGAVAAGALGIWLVCRRKGASFAAMADSLAPGLAIAQGIGRLGNWFNQELFGRPSTLPWALEIDPAHRPAGYEQYATFHPTFLYELLWVLLVALVLVLVDRRLRLGHGQVFLLYVVLYTFGRFWVEGLRIDKANTIGTWRINEYVSVIVFVAALVALVLVRLRHRDREAPEAVDPDGRREVVEA
ncbi:prolipoprotein diacylglyceryl transferase [Raineyella antarctica]|uniref:Phosphatidylglycerol--prolipoprotein diacylglyceryl transferase n=1 Tax=Raineyella antarctica TaxID=1577474 RepID=A0A1G6GTK4_9ACTN|nr:prolipoprotein diacylglyceryl transferase [Raineyella antarctica]SDB85279.1 prolipoprotein diacylglyceryl transferase [Raineyella antarctica]